MPFQPINFASIEPIGNPALRDLAGNLMRSFAQGMQLRQMPEQMQRQAESEQLANQLKSLQVQQEPQRFQSALDAAKFKSILEQAKAQEMQKRVQSPFFGVPTGEVGQAVAYDIIKNNPDMQGAFQQFTKMKDLEQRNIESNINYREKIAGSIDKARSTILAKNAQELDEINAGFMPGTNGKVTISPDEQEALKGQYELKMQKEVSDSDTRKRALFASNIDKTIEGINPKDLTQYSGAAGQLKLKGDQLASSLGKPTDSFKAYNKALTLSNLLAKQVRQFYGDSITPQIQEKLAMLTNPTSWTNSPDIAMDNFNTFKDILQKETQTYRRPLRDVKEFRGEDKKELKEESKPKRLKFNPATGGFE